MKHNCSGVSLKLLRTKFHVLSKADEGEHGTVMWNNVASTSSTILVFCHFVHCFGASVCKVASIVMLVINKLIHEVR